MARYITPGNVMGSSVMSPGLSGYRGLSCWVKPHALPTGINHPWIPFVSSGPAAASPQGWLNYQPTGVVQYAYGQSSNSQIVNGSTTLTLNQWNHVLGIAVDTSLKIQLWINGVKDGEIPFIDGTSALTYVQIAGQTVNGDQGDLEIAEVSVWGNYLLDNDVIALSQGAHPLRFHNVALAFHWAIWGISANEPELATGGANITTVVGSTTQATTNPPVEPFSRRYWSTSPISANSSIPPQTASGGIAVNNTANSLPILAYAVSAGNIVIDGIALATTGYIQYYTGSGGSNLGSGAVIYPTYLYAASGGSVFGGVALAVNGYIQHYTGSGNVEIGGTATAARANIASAGPFIYDRVMETTTTTGTTQLTLNGAVTGFQSFAVVGDNNTCYYVIQAVDSNGISTGDWEVGVGTYIASGTYLTRNTIFSSSNTGGLVNFSAGAKRVFISVPSHFSAFSGLASITATDHGVLGDGITDNTAAMQACLNSFGTQGGGIIVIPPGQYKFSGHLNIPNNVTLQGSNGGVATHVFNGDMGVPHEPLYFNLPGPGDGATVLIVLETGSTAFITMNTNSTLRGVSLYWANQVETSPPIAYPWAIQMSGSNGVVDEVELINCYMGILAQNVIRPLIRNVFGQFLLAGVKIDGCADIARFENIHWNPAWSYNTAVHAWANANGIAFAFYRTDEQQVSGCFTFTGYIGFYFDGGVLPNGWAGPSYGSMVNCGCDTTQYSLVFNTAEQHTGWQISNQHFGSQTIDVLVAGGVDLKLSNCTIWGGKTHFLQVLSAATNASVKITGANISSYSGSAFDMQTGRLIVSVCEFKETTPQISLSGDGSAIMTSCFLNGGQNTSNTGTGSLTVSANVAY